MRIVCPFRAGLLAVAVAFVSLPTQAQAGFINGNFDAGLTGWQVSDSTYVTAVNGVVTFARINESPVATEVTLFQDITIDPGSTKLSFLLIDSVPGPNTMSFLPDAFNVSLLVPTTSMSLVPTATPFTDGYYIFDLVPGAPNPQMGTGVTVTALGGGVTQVDLDVSSSLLQGASARLQFRLLGGGDFVDDTSVSVDDVSLSSPTVAAVPAPSTAVLLATGCLSLVFARLYRRGTLRDAPAAVV